MSKRIPSSLNWLIDRYARVAGDIEATQKLLSAEMETTQGLISIQDALAAKLAASLSGVDALKGKLADLQKDLSSIHRTMQLHDIKVNAELIPPIGPYGKRIKLPYGELTSALLSFLRKNMGEPLSTNELTFMLVEKFSHLSGTSHKDRKALRAKVGYQLKKLAETESIVRAPFPDTQTKKSTRWALPMAIPRP